MMPRDLMHRGPRPPGPRASWEFDEVYLCRELDDEEREAEPAEPVKEREEESYEGAELPEFAAPKKKSDPNWPGYSVSP